MKNIEMQAALHMVIARLESNPTSSVEWAVIVDHLATVLRSSRRESRAWATAEAKQARRDGDRVDGYDRDDLGPSEDL